jgi:hypothetical protein
MSFQIRHITSGKEERIKREIEDKDLSKNA